MIQKIQYYNTLYKRFGFRALQYLVARKFSGQRYNPAGLLGLKHPLLLSNNGPDVMTMFQVFLANEYEVTFTQQPKFIIDCGANIGLSAVYFAHQFPAATIVAIEPDSNNFSVLQKNTAPYPNVHCINKAIWSHATKMQLVDPGFGNWGLQTKEGTGINGTGMIDAVGIIEIMEAFKQNKIDLLKIDIEGAEKELFSKNVHDWLKSTSVIAIELHDNIDPAISSIYYNAVQQYPHKESQKGENVICDFR